MILAKERDSLLQKERCESQKWVREGMDDGQCREQASEGSEGRTKVRGGHVLRWERLEPVCIC